MAKPPRQPRRKAVFTEGYISSLKPSPKPYQCWDKTQAGLAIRVEPTGSMSWKVIYKFEGRKRDYTIGNVAKFGLANARKVAKAVMVQVAMGKDPQATKSAGRTAGTFNQIADRYLKEKAQKKNKSWKQADSLVRKHLCPKWGHMKAASIKRADVKEVIAKITVTAPIVANQTLAAASAIFSFAVKEELLNVNPCHGVDRNVTKDRERVLSDAEIAIFWREFGEVGVEGAALKTILLLGQRPGEVSQMRTEHIIDGFWNLPGEPIEELGWPGTKNKLSHRVWVSAPAREIITEMRTPGFVFAGPRGGAVYGLAGVMSDICARLKIQRATPHDLRRTFGTSVTRLKHGRDAMDRILNHKKKSKGNANVTDIYDRHAYGEDDKIVMESVAAHVMSIVDKRINNVLPFAGKAL